MLGGASVYVCIWRLEVSLSVIPQAHCFFETGSLSGTQGLLLA